MTGSVRAPDEEIEFAAQIEQRRNQPDLCTIYRSSADETQRMSEWITAKGEAFVDPRTRQ